MTLQRLEKKCPAAAASELQSGLKRKTKFAIKMSRKVSGAREKSNMAEAMADAVTAAKHGGPVIVHLLKPGAGNGKSIRTICNAMAKEAPDAAIFVIAETSDGHVHCAAAADSVNNDLGAGTWLRLVMERVGGRGGGSDTFAQGALRRMLHHQLPLLTRLKFKALRRRLPPVQNYSESFFALIFIHTQFLTTTFCVLSAQLSRLSLAGRCRGHQQRRFWQLFRDCHSNSLPGKQR